MSLLTYTEWLVDESINKLKQVYSPKRLKKLAKTISFMPDSKIDHSFRVGATVAKAGLSKRYVDAAVLHDYLERGGDPNVLNRLGLSANALNIIKILSIEEKTPGADDNEIVYQHVVQMLQNREIPQRIKDIAIIIKCSDRLDNLRKRVKASKLNADYYYKSMRLLTTLSTHFAGPAKWLEFIKAKLNKLNRKIEERHLRPTLNLQRSTVPQNYTPTQGVSQ
jgi:hypothetical protein